MEMMKRVICGVACAVVLLSAVSSDAQRYEDVRGRIRIAGSSTVGPLTMAVMERFREQFPNVDVSNAVTGTGGGFKRFTAGETDISNASRPIKPAEIEAAKKNGIEFIELPVAFDGLSIVVHPENSWANELTIDELKKIFSADTPAQNWSDVREGWPDRPIRIFTPGTDSGTFDYFVEAVLGDEGQMRGDVTVSEDDNVLVRGVSEEKDAIGFFGCAYYFDNQSRLRAVPINDGHGPVMPTPETIESGEYTPFSRPLFIYVNTSSADRPEVRQFVEYYMRSAGHVAEEVGYVGLPRRLYALMIRDRFRKGETGSIFYDENGEPTHATLREAYGL